MTIRNIKIEDSVLTKSLEKAFFLYDLPGLSIQINQGEKEWSKVFGFQNAVTKTALRKDHVFHMASVTKLLVGTCVLKLCDENKLKLDETLVSYLPDFEMADPRYTEITLRQLLSHTSGMPDVTDYHWDKPETDADALRRYVYSDEVQKARLLWAPSVNK
ncbi:MAG: serine hydrolase, partial [Eubacteriales bacterium]|nr:serine hydrolase [Eubacteriales bacterium]